MSLQSLVALLATTTGPYQQPSGTGSLVLPSPKTDPLDSDISCSRKRLRDEHHLPTDSQVSSFANHRRMQALSTPKDQLVPCAAASASVVIKLNVGGTVFYVSRETLLGKHALHQIDRTEENYFHQLLNPSGGFPVDTDDDGSIFIDRDDATFAMILNYLRGYQNSVIVGSEHALAMLQTDAEYYRLKGLQSILRVRDRFEATQFLFNKGPCVSPEGFRFRTMYGVAFVGERFLMRGRHSITFFIPFVQYIGLGVASDHFLDRDVEFHKITNCCLLYVTGVFYSNLPNFRKEESGPKFGNGDFVTINLDMDAKVLSFHVNGLVKTVCVRSATKLRFAVVMKMNSSIQIVDSRSESPQWELLAS